MNNYQLYLLPLDPHYPVKVKNKNNFNLNQLLLAHDTTLRQALREYNYQVATDAIYTISVRINTYSHILHARTSDGYILHLTEKQVDLLNQKLNHAQKNKIDLIKVLTTFVSNELINIQD